MKIADLFFQAQLDDGKLQVDAKKSGDKAGQTMGGQLSTSLGKTAFVGFGLGAGANTFKLLKDAVGEVTSAIGDSITAASDLNETINKSQVVFGSSAGEIQKWGSTAATSMGLSENAAIGAAASIGNLLLSTGTAKEKIAPMSEGIVQLASDLASFNNIPIEDALAKLQSGLVGQERPLRELGVAISAASVDTEAAALGFHKLNGVFSEGEKVQARYSLIFKQTGTAQGDFARTSDGLANTQRILNAELNDAQAKIGQALLPFVTKLAHVIVTDVIPAVEGFFHDLDNLNQTLHITDILLPAIGSAWDTLTRPLRAVGDALFEIDYGFRKLTGGTITAEDEFRNMAINAGMSVDDLRNRIKQAMADAGIQINTLAGKAADDVDHSFGAGGTIPAAFEVSGEAATRAASQMDLLKSAAARFDSTAQLAATDTQTLTDAIYGPATSLTAAVDLAKDHVIDLQGQLKKLTDKKDKTSADKRALGELLADLHTAKTDLLVAEARKLQLTGGAVPKELNKYLTTGEQHLTTMSHEAFLAWKYLHDLAGLGDYKYVVEFKSDIGHHAAGGFAPYGLPAVFGEEGPEIGIPRPGGFEVLTAQKTRALADSLFVPRAMHAAMADLGAFGGGAASHVTNNNVSVNYADPSRAPEDFGRTLRRLTSLGIS